MILLDTHVVLWLDQGAANIGPKARTILDLAQERGEISICGISFWEIAMLERKNRITTSLDLAEWRQRLLSAGLQEWAIDGATGILAAQLHDLHSDPADRMIVATAIRRGAQLMTADERMLNWSGNLDRLDACR